jgi:hypothetical protein
MISAGTSAASNGMYVSVKQLVNKVLMETISKTEITVKVFNKVFG